MENIKYVEDLMQLYNSGVRPLKTQRQLRGALSGLRQFLTTEKPFKDNVKCSVFQLKNTFRFQKYLKFCLDFLVMQKSNVIRKIRLISNLGCHNLENKQSQYTYCPNISRIKDNQTMKFGQLIEYDMRSIFLENLLEKLFPHSFLKFPN